MPQIKGFRGKKTKNQEKESIKNPFYACIPYLPRPLGSKLKDMDKIFFKNIENLVSNLSQDPQQNYSFIKMAIQRQEQIVDDLKKELEEKKQQTQRQTHGQQLVEDEDFKHKQFLKDQEYLDCILFKGEDSSNFFN